MCFPLETNAAYFTDTFSVTLDGATDNDQAYAPKTQSVNSGMTTLERLQTPPPDDLLTESFSFAVGKTIADNDATGYSNTQNIISGISSIGGLQVTLNISGGYNGDLYAYLYFSSSVQPSSAFTVLLNRSGRTGTDTSGFADGGMNVTFDNTASNGDIHNYKSVIDPHGGVLTGTWQPDARNVHPDLSVDTIARTADMSGFKGLNPNGSWTLFIADDSASGVATLQSWGIQITAVPEPATRNVAICWILLVIVFRRLRNLFRPA